MSTTVPDAARGPRRRRAVIGEVLIAAVISLVAAGGMNWDVVRGLGSTIPGDGVDPFIEIWSFAWSAHVLNPGTTGGIFEANAFYPAHDSLAFTDSLLGLGPLAWPIGAEHIVWAFSAVFLLMSALASFGGYVLARQLGANWIGAAVAGAAYAYPPWRLGQLSHLHVLSFGAMALALALLARGHGVRWRRFASDADLPQPRTQPLWIVLGWAVAAWQLPIGFAQGLPLAYLLAVLAVIAVLAVPVHTRFAGRGPASRPWVRPRAALTRPAVVADLAGGAVFAATGLFMALPYLRVEKAEAAAVEYARGVVQVQAYSPGWGGLVTPPALPGTWSWLTGGATLTEGTNEARLLPGVILLVLAAGGIALSSFPRRWRLTLLLAIGVTTVFALGSTVSIGGLSPFLWLRDHAPGWASDRTPGRLICLISLGLALLAAGFITALTHALQRRLRRSGPPATRSRTARFGLAAAAGLLPLLILAEGAGPIPTVAVPPVPRAMEAAAGPMIVLPSIWTYDSTVMYFSARIGFPQVANGASGITPSDLAYMRRQMLRFPDQRSVDYLRAFGFRSVIVLKQDFGTDQWADAGRVPADGLGLTRTEYRDSILYQLTG